MSTQSKQVHQLLKPRQRLARKRLADQLRTESLHYCGLSDQETIDQFIEQEMMAYRLDVLYHESALSIGLETQADRPKMPPLLCLAMKYECQFVPKAVYAAQLLMATMENRELNLELEQVKAEKDTLQTVLDGLTPNHQIRAN